MSKLLRSNQLASVVRIADLQMEDGRVDGQFTEIRRGVREPETFVYDSVWIDEQGKYYAYVDYSFFGQHSLYHFFVVWALPASDSNACVYAVWSNLGSRTSHPKINAVSNVDSVALVSAFPQYHIDTMQKRLGKIEFSYRKLWVQPQEFFLDIKLNGQSLRDLSPLYGYVH